MTTFEIAIIVLLAAIVVLLIWQTHRNNKVNERYVEQFDLMCETLSNIRGDTVDIFQELNNIEDNILDESNGIPALVDIVDKMHRNLCVEIADKMVDRVYPPTYNPPCYAPNGICTNPQMDCINCPKRGTGGTWSTNISIKAEDAPLQERFNDNKEY